VLLPVLRIHEILVRIQIRIPGSVPLTDPDPALLLRILLRIMLFSSVSFKMATKKKYFSRVFAHQFLKLHLHNFSKIKSHPDPDPDLVLTDPDPGGPKTYGSYGSGFATLQNILFFLVRSICKYCVVDRCAAPVRFGTCFKTNTCITCSKQHIYFPNLNKKYCTKLIKM
jgi:hypothetical protein